MKAEVVLDLVLGGSNFAWKNLLCFFYLPPSSAVAILCSGVCSSVLGGPILCSGVCSGVLGPDVVLRSVLGCAPGCHKGKNVPRASRDLKGK